MTETLSLISVVVMALLLWREHRNAAYWRKKWAVTEVGFAQTYGELQELQAEHLRWSDRDEKGRFVKRERGSSI